MKITIKTVAANLWPGMIICGPGRFNDHSHRGRIMDIGCRSDAPDGTERLEVFFHDDHPSILFDATHPIEIKNEF